MTTFGGFKSVILVLLNCVELYYYYMFAPNHILKMHFLYKYDAQFGAEVFFLINTIQRQFMCQRSNSGRQIMLM